MIERLNPFAYRLLKALLSSLLLLLFVLPCSADNQPLVVGSKRFTESYILGEIIRQVAESAGETQVISRPGLGNTSIVFAALANGNIDVYPEYSGTVAHDLLHSDDAPDLDRMNALLEKQTLHLGVPLGFNNTYGLAVSADLAQRLHIDKISDLKAHPELRLGLSHEFLNRQDGWKGLRANYDLPFVSPQGFDHDLSYQALAQHQVDVVDIYSTDAKILKYHLQVLQDDRHFFPHYDALLLYRQNLPARLPKTWAALQRLQGRISNEQMREMNALMELDRMTPATIAGQFLHGQLPQAKIVNNALTSSVVAKQVNPFSTFFEQLFAPDFWRLTWQHLYLVFASLALGAAVGVPLGILAAGKSTTAQPILSAVGLIQTIPSLALLAFLIPLLHTVGVLPAIIALFLYCLLPIVRNTYTGLTEIAPSLRESALALGLPWTARLRLIELPLAARSILSGIKTSAIINVGMATIAAFIGAGGYGERIVSGLATGDDTMLLAGALPSAALALLVQAVFDLLEKNVVPAGLRVKT